MAALMTSLAKPSESELSAVFSNLLITPKGATSSLNRKSPSAGKY
jgi:hypothetical protein